MPIEFLGLDGLALTIVRAVVLATGAFALTLGLVRLVGLRAFSKMTSFDFVATVATASLIAQAATRTDWSEYVQALTAIVAVFLIQWSLAKLRLNFESARRVIRNQPQVLVLHGEFLEEAMHACRVTRSDILEQIRASSATTLDAVLAVVLETTGEMTVLTGDRLDWRLLEGVETPPSTGPNDD